MKPVAVKGCTIAVKESGISFTSAVIDTPESHEVNIDGNGAYFGELKVTVTGIIYQKSYAVANPVVFTISPTAEKVSSNDNMAVLEGDESATVTGIVAIKTPQDTRTFSMTIYISKAGQDSVTAE